MSAPDARARFTDPLAAGIVLGLILFAAILVSGRGLGASGAFATTAASVVQAVSPATVAAHPYLASWRVTGPAGLAGDWVVIELLGVAAGAWLSARMAGRLQRGVERADGESARARIMSAIVGGALMGGGARLAHGCTSGLALTGGALLSTGAWLFIPVAFGTAMVVAFIRRPSAVQG